MATRKAPSGQQAPAATVDSGPTATRARFPKEYGVAKNAKVLPWSYVTERLTNAQHYWICTVKPDGLPHAIPVDAIWLDDCLYFGGSPETRWRRNLSTNPAVCVHLESTMDVVTLQGYARLEAVGHTVAQRLAELSKKKYGYASKPEEYEKNGALAFRPRVAFAWTSTLKDPTRWSFTTPNA